MTAPYQIVLTFVRNLRQMWRDFLSLCEYGGWD
jgi:hypothetical protein